MTFRKFEEDVDLFEYCDYIENEAENQVKFPLIREIRIILKDLKVRQRSVDFAKFKLDDLIKFRDRLYQKMKKILSVNFVFKKPSKFTESQVELIPLDEDVCYFAEDNKEFEDFDLPGYRTCNREYEERIHSSREEHFNNTDEFLKIKKIKEFVSNFNREEFYKGKDEYELIKPKKVINGCQSGFVNHRFSRENQLYKKSSYFKICDDIKPNLVQVYDDGILKYCNKNNLLYLLLNGKIDLRLTEDMINSLTKENIMELNDYFGTNDDPYPLGYCWLNLFAEDCHSFLIEQYAPFLTATEIFKVIQKHSGILRLLSLDHEVNYYIIGNYGHFTFSETPSSVNYEFKSNAYELLSELYTREYVFRDDYEAEEAKLNCMYNLLLCTEEFEDSYFSTEYFTFDFVNGTIHVFRDIAHTIVLRYFKVESNNEEEKIVYHNRY